MKKNVESMKSFRMYHKRSLDGDADKTVNFGKHNSFMDLQKSKFADKNRLNSERELELEDSSMFMNSNALKSKIRYGNLASF